ncbi:MAG: mechanosensitive ion channel family protein [Anaerolineae bacterium]|jgi:small-conductance mechanosensitive channel
MDITQAWDTVQEMADTIVSQLPVIGLGIIIFGLFYLLGIWIKALTRRFVRATGLTEGASIVLGRLSRWGVSFLGALLAVNIAVPSFTTGELIQLLGIGSVAIGFAFRDILQNFLSGILLLLTEPFHIGDQIVIDSFEGTVEEVQTRATMIRTYDGRRIVIPNSDLFTDSVIVNTAFALRRSEYDFGIGYGDDAELAQRLILEAISGVEGVASDPPPEVFVVELGDFSLNIRSRWWTNSRRGDVVETRSRVVDAVQRKLASHHIDMPFPTQQVLFHDQTEATDGDRALQREGWPAGAQGAPRSRTIAGALEKLADRLAGER